MPDRFRTTEKPDFRSKLLLRLLFVLVCCSQFPAPIYHQHENERTESTLLNSSLASHLIRHHVGNATIDNPVHEGWHLHFVLPSELNVSGEKSSKNCWSLGCWANSDHIVAIDRSDDITPVKVVLETLQQSADFHNLVGTHDAHTLLAFSNQPSLGRSSHVSLLCVMRC